MDFGLAKRHLDKNSKPVAQRKKADFRGTVSFASLNAHNSIDLSRRDDLWSLYFVILDFLRESLKWREQKEYSMEQVKEIKTQCLEDPEKYLWVVTKDVQEVKNIFYHLKKLNYSDKPDYDYIRNELKTIYLKNQLPHTDMFEPMMPQFNREQNFMMGQNAQLFKGMMKNLNP